MGISQGGLFGHNNGKVGKLVYYMRKGKLIVRTQGKITKAPTEDQLKCRQEMAVATAFCKVVKPFIDFGFAGHVGYTDKSPSNFAVSINKQVALKGTYPNIQLDYAKAVVSEGRLLRADEAKVTIAEAGIRFDWYVQPNMSWPDNTDQVMMLAYFPKLNKTVYRLFGPERPTGTATLPISAPMLDEHVETYVAFISADRKHVSDSVYAGGFNIPEQN